MSSTMPPGRPDTGAAQSSRSRRSNQTSSARNSETSSSQQGKKKNYKKSQTDTENPLQKQAAILPPLNFEYRDEKLQIKAAITFFALKAVGCLCKFYMVQGYRRDGANYKLAQGERVLYEGLFITSSISTNEVILKMVEEKVFSPSDDSETLKNIFSDDRFIHLNLTNVAWMEVVPDDPSNFCANLTRNGFDQIPKPVPAQAIVQSEPTIADEPALPKAQAKPEPVPAP